MDIKNLLQDESAVSPVIGVILMVAITVILAAVIGTFVLGLGDQVQTTAPQASFTFDFIDDSSTDKLTITHDGGDSIEAARLNVTASTSFSHNSSVGTGSWAASPYGSQKSSYNFADIGTGQASAGTSFNIGNVDLNSATVRVVWTSSTGDSSATLAKWSGPDA
jgi:flagellin-like protein